METFIKQSKTNDSTLENPQKLPLQPVKSIEPPIKQSKVMKALLKTLETSITAH